MPLLLSEVTDDADFDEITQCECVSYETPLNTFFRLFRYDDSPAGFTELRDRQIRDWRNDPTSRWFKVVDTDLGGKIIGAANWNTFTEEEPYAGMKGAPVADWWPEGEPREFASALLACLLGQRWQKMNRPHMLLAWLFVHPDQRRRGAATKLIQWGLDQADNLNIEAFLEATEDGKPCYETLGFIYMGTRFWRTGKQNPSQQWEEMERYLQMPVPTHLMWRPKGGRFVEGETVLPWEVEE